MQRKHCGNTYLTAKKPASSTVCDSRASVVSASIHSASRGPNKEDTLRFMDTDPVTLLGQQVSLMWIIIGAALVKIGRAHV